METRVTGDEAQRTMGKRKIRDARFLLPVFLCAQMFIETQRRLGTRQPLKMLQRSLLFHKDFSYCRKAGVGSCEKIQFYTFLQSTRSWSHDVCCKNHFQVQQVAAGLINACQLSFHCIFYLCLVHSLSKQSLKSLWQFISYGGWKWNHVS